MIEAIGYMNKREKLLECPVVGVQKGDDAIGELSQRGEPEARFRLKHAVCTCNEV